MFCTPFTPARRFGRVLWFAGSTLPACYYYSITPPPLVKQFLQIFFIFLFLVVFFFYCSRTHARAHQNGLHTPKKFSKKPIKATLT